MTWESFTKYKDPWGGFSTWEHNFRASQLPSFLFFFFPLLGEHSLYKQQHCPPFLPQTSALVPSPASPVACLSPGFFTWKMMALPAAGGVRVRWAHINVVSRPNLPYLWSGLNPHMWQSNSVENGGYRLCVDKPEKEWWNHFPLRAPVQ